MTVGLDRAALESDLAKALSRHIGYTTAAFDLDRIVSVLSAFENRPSAYREEILAHLKECAQDGRQKKDAYLTEAITFAAAFEIIQQTSTQSRLQKFSPTELGRSLYAAQNCDEGGEFFAFFLAVVVFRADADVLLFALRSAADQSSVSSEERYVAYTRELRERRYAWLKAAFSQPIIRDRIERRIPWLTFGKNRLEAPRIEEITLNTARHHLSPRRGWLERLNMLDDQRKHLTELGRGVLEVLAPERGYFWLGPPKGTQEALGVQREHLLEGPFVDELTFRSSLNLANADQNENLSEAVAEVMIKAFPFARLLHAPQASLILPLEYIRYRSFVDEAQYDPIQVLDFVFRSKKNTIERLSAFRGALGFYRVR